MINLLPEEEKKALILERKKRMIIILGLLVLLNLFCLILILYSINIHLLGKSESTKILAETEEQEFKKLEYEKLQKEIQNLNRKMVQISNFYQQQFFLTEILEQISELLPPGTYLKSLNYQKVEKTFILSGFAQTREILLSLKEKLEAQENFREVYFPPENWIKPQAIDFYLTFQLK